MRLALVTVVVPGYDAALAFFVGILGFVPVEDTDLGGDKRWVVVAPHPGAETCVLLARAVGDQACAVGDQAGGRVFLFLHTDDLAGDAARLAAAGVMFEGPPRRELYGTVVVFRDPFGNRWDLVEPSRA